MHIVRAHFILFVADQTRSAAFFRRVLDVEPTLDVPGMTEFALGTHLVLGLIIMPERGIARLLGGAVDPAAAAGVPRAELYVVVDDPGAAHARAVDAGAVELSPLSPRDWGDDVAYSQDPDGHVLAFARSTAPPP